MHVLNTAPGFRKCYKGDKSLEGALSGGLVVISSQLWTVPRHTLHSHFLLLFSTALISTVRVWDLCLLLLSAAAHFRPLPGTSLPFITVWAVSTRARLTEGGENIVSVCTYCVQLRKHTSKQNANATYMYMYTRCNFVISTREGNVHVCMKQWSCYTETVTYLD